MPGSQDELLSFFGVLWASRALGFRGLGFLRCRVQGFRGSGVQGFSGLGFRV